MYMYIINKIEFIQQANKIANTKTEFGFGNPDCDTAFDFMGKGAYKLKLDKQSAV